MANSIQKVYALCPYFLGEKRKIITCEDVYRIFNDLDSKYAWMDMYCNNAWEDCPYAKRLDAAYKSFDEGDGMALKDNEIKSLRDELKSASMKLGWAERKLRKKNQEYIDLENKNKLIHKRYRDMADKLADYEENEAKRYITMAMLYEDRIAFLIDTYCNGRLEEKDVKEWADGKEYALTFDKDSKEPIWIVEVREAEDELLGEETKEE